MKVTHAELFNRAAENYDFAAIWKVEDACKRDLEEAEKAYDEAVARYFNAIHAEDKKSAEVETDKTRIAWLEKLAAYLNFYSVY